MTGSTYKHTAPIEDLLRGLADAAAVRREHEELHGRTSGIDGRSIAAAALALFIFVPGCAAATAFLLQSDEAFATPTQVSTRKPLLAKTDRLALPGQAADSASGTHAFIESETAPQVQGDAGFLGSFTIRGRIEDALTETFADGHAAQDVAALAEKSPSPPRQKPKRHHTRARLTKLVAETAPPAPEPPSLLQRLFGVRSL